MTQSSADPVVLSPASSVAAHAYRSSSTSPSRSSKRRQQFTPIEPDPLLANLSPTSTLKALNETNAIQGAGRNDRSALSDSIADASTSERALGIRAALAGKKLRDWYNEVKGWDWPTTGFERLSESEEDCHATPGGTSKLYWGSMLAEDIQAYEKYIETIRDEMEALDVEELKDHVRGAHLSSRARPQSSFGAQDLDSPALTYTHLDDFTAIITTTIMQALPYIFRLNALLDLWTTRLLVLRQVPGWSIRMEDSKVAMEAAWTAIGRVKDKSAWVPSDLSRKALQTMKIILEDKITELGKRTDTMLDLLEGGVDHLPDTWIDRLDQLEEDYRGWVVDAERVMLDNEWRENQSQSRPNVISEPRRILVDVSNADSRPSPKTTAPLNFSTCEEACEEACRERFGPSDLRSSQQLIESTNQVSISEDSITPNLGLLGSPKSIVSIPTIISTLRETDNSSKDSLDEETSRLKTEALREVPLVSQSSKLPTLPLNSSAPQFRNLEEPTEFDYFSTRRTDNVGSEPTLGSDMIDSYKSNPKILAKLLPMHRPAPLDLNCEPSIYDSHHTSETPYPRSPSSGGFSNMSSPEILSASRVEYFGTPTEIKTPLWASREPLTPANTVSRHSSQRVEMERASNKDADVSKSAPPLHPRSRASSLLPELIADENSLSNTTSAPSATTSESESERPAPVLKRASTTSIEILQNSELRKLTLTRSGSHSSTSSALDRVRNEGISGRRSSMPGVIERPLAYAKSKGHTPSSPFSAIEDVQDQSPSVRSYNKRNSIIGPHLKTELPFGFPKVPAQPLGRLRQHSSRDGGTTSAKRTGVEKTSSGIKVPGNSLNNSTSKRASPQNLEDQLDAKIHSILTNIPARIRFTSRPDADTLEVQRPRAASSSKPGNDNLTPPTRLDRAQTAFSSMTIVPANKTPQARTPAGESEIKLYHLHQPGKDVPIKLYVRLVGECGERVMVRVGGGWADLGEYLKEYASHHGRRSISDGRFKIQGLSASQSAMSVTTLAGFGSGQSTPSGPNSPEFQSSASIKSRRLRLSDASTTEWRAPNTPEVSSYKQQDATPRSVESTASWRPSSRMSWTDDDAPLGLAGPTSKKKEISPGKQAWVDGMLDQARQASADKRKGEAGDLGDLGKIGGTRRVFLKAKKGDL